MFCVFVILYTVTDFSAAEKSGVKLCMLVRLLSAMSFSHFCELWLAGSHGGGITSGMSYIEIAVGQSELGAVGWWQLELGAAAWCKAVWWDFRLASVLTHLL